MIFEGGAAIGAATISRRSPPILARTKKGQGSNWPRFMHRYLSLAMGMPSAVFHEIEWPKFAWIFDLRPMNREDGPEKIGADCQIDRGVTVRLADPVVLAVSGMEMRSGRIRPGFRGFYQILDRNETGLIRIDAITRVLTSAAVSNIH